MKRFPPKKVSNGEDSMSSSSENHIQIRVPEPEMLDPKKFLPYCRLSTDRFEMFEPIQKSEPPKNRFRLFFAGMEKSFGDVFFRWIGTASSLEECALEAELRGKEAICVIPVKTCW